MNQKRKIAVFGGTPIDTLLGAELLRAKQLEAIQYPMSASPQDQSDMQYFDQSRLEQNFEEKVHHAKAQGAEQILIYCNSLSSAIDYKAVGQRQNIPIISPLDSYKNLKGYRNLAILAANAISAYRVDHIISQNSQANTISLANLALVKAIEAQDPPKQIIKDLAIDRLLAYLETIKKPQPVDGLVLACTHFPYLEEELKELTQIAIINPDKDLIKRLKNS